MIYLAPKAPADVADYLIDLVDYIPAPAELDDVEVTIITAGNGEDPIALQVESFNSVASPIVKDRNIAVLIWLSGGTKDVRYVGQISFSDTASTEPDRRIEREFQIEVKKL